MITFDDLGDRTGILKVLQELTQANQKFGDSAEDAIDRAEKAVKSLTATMLDYQRIVQGNTKQAVGLKDDIIATTSAYRNQSAILSQHKGLVESNGKVIAQMEARLAALRQEYDKLDATQKRDRQRQREIVQELSQSTKALAGLTTATNLAGRTVKAAENSFNALKQQTHNLKQQLDSIPDAYEKSTGKINQQNRAVVALNEQYQKNIALIHQIERGQKISTGNAGPVSASASPSGLSTVGAFAAGAVGIGSASILADQVLSGIKKAGDIILQYDSLDSALQVVSNDTLLFTQRQTMLQRVSDDLGQDLSVVEKTYTNLTASSKGTRLEGEKTDKIFTAVTGTMGRLKKSGEDTEGALVAIGQMMSKGTIQSEELRGQLGERIPGAFNIMARALGVTTAKLGDMLKNGEVLASDALPKFAVELERTFNPNNEKRVEGLAANLARMRNEGVEWVKSLNVGDKAGEFIGWITSISRSIRQVFSASVEESSRKLAEQKDKVNDLEGAIPSLLTRYDELKSKSKLSADEQKELQTVVNNLARLAPSAATGFDAYGNALDVNKGKVLSFTQAQRQLNAELNKQAIADLERQAGASIATLQDRQRRLNYGRELKGSFARLFSRSDNRYQDLTDDRKKELQGEISTLSDKAMIDAQKIITMGGRLSGELRKYVENSSNYSVKQLLVVDDYNRKIAEKQAIAADLFQKGAFKQREVVVTEIKKLQADLGQIVNPSQAGSKAAVDEPATTKAKEQETVLETIDKQIKSIETTLQRQAMQDLKAGRIIDVDPKLVAKVQKLKEEYEAIKAVQEAVENGTYGKKIATPNKLTTSDLDRLGERPYVDYRLDEKGRQLSESDIAEADAKRTAQLNDNLGKQSDIMALYYIKRQRLAYDFNNTLHGLDLHRQQEWFSLMDQMEAAERAGNAAEVQRLKEKYAQMSEEDKAYLSRKQEIEDKYIEVGTTLANGLFEIEQQNNANRLTALEASKQAELDAVGNSEGARAAIEKKYDAERKRIQHQQDIAARDQALFNIAISAGVAIAKTLEVGGPFATPLAFAIGALAAAQAAVVLAKPLPQYFAGKNIDGITNDSYSGPAIAGERGRELWQHDGKLELVDKPSLIKVGRSDVIYPNHMTEHMLQANAIVGQTNRQSVAGYQLAQNREDYQTHKMAGSINWDNFPIKRLADAIGEANTKLPFTSHTFDGRGYTFAIVKECLREIDANKSFRFRR